MTPPKDRVDLIAWMAEQMKAREAARHGVCDDDDTAWDRARDALTALGAAGVALVPVVDLQAIEHAMNHMGDVLNNMDAVSDQDLAETQPGWDALERVTASPYAPNPEARSDG